MGLHRAGFEVVGFDIKEQPRYPFEFHQRDVMTMTPEEFREFDAVWASPPCHAYIQRNKNLETKHPKLIEPTRKLLKESGLPYIIENVPGAPLRWPLQLCGTQFGLKVLRHRWFEIPCAFIWQQRCYHRGAVATGEYAGVYAFGGKGQRHGPGVRDPKNLEGPDWAEAMGIDWMKRDELTQAIPPAYSEYLGLELMKVLATT